MVPVFFFSCSAPFFVFVFVFLFFLFSPPLLFFGKGRLPFERSQPKKDALFSPGHWVFEHAFLFLVGTTIALFLGLGKGGRPVSSKAGVVFVFCCWGSVPDPMVGITVQQGVFFW